MACLDTSVILDLAGRGGKARMRNARQAVRQTLQDNPLLCTTRFNVAELWVGVYRARERRDELSRVRAILKPMRILDFDESAARVFGRITARLQTLGRPSGDVDVLVASVARVNGQSVVTRNVRHFRGIPGLTLISYD